MVHLLLLLLFVVVVIVEVGCYIYLNVRITLVKGFFQVLGISAFEDVLRCSRVDFHGQVPSVISSMTD